MISSIFFNSLFAVSTADFFSENAPLENIQVLALLLALLLFLSTLLFKKMSGSAIVAFLAVICYAGILREVDFDKMNLHPVLTFMLYGAGRHLTISLGFALSLGWALLHFKNYLKASLNFLKNPEGAFMIIAAILILTSQIAEHSSWENNVAWEEISELCAYLFIFASSLAVSLGKNTYKEAVDSASSKLIKN